MLEDDTKEKEKVELVYTTSNDENRNNENIMINKNKRVLKQIWLKDIYLIHLINLNYDKFKHLILKK